jgi:hypothetical protein
VLMLTIFHHPETKTLCLAVFFARKKDACNLSKHFFFLHKKACLTKSFVSGG